MKNVARLLCTGLLIFVVGHLCAASDAVRKRVQRRERIAAGGPLISRDVAAALHAFASTPLADLEKIPVGRLVQAMMLLDRVKSRITAFEASAVGQLEMRDHSEFELAILMRQLEHQKKYGDADASVRVRRLEKEIKQLCDYCGELCENVCDWKVGPFPVETDWADKLDE